MYVPKPIDTTDIVLSDDIQKLTELIAKNTHERWALQKINDGWTYGEVFSYENKTHPCILEYESLSEGDKDYDRITSLETIKTLLKLGYKITKD